MNEKKVQRKWALVVAILATLWGITELAKGVNVTDPYERGHFIGTIAIPAIFYFLAFKKKSIK
jgi:hypothetical protein